MPKAILFDELGGADVLRVEEVPDLEPAEGEVRIAVETLGINRAEIMFREGRYHDKPVFPSRIGYEACGAIDAVGTGAKGLAVGDRVSTIPCFSMVEHGVCGEQAVVPAFAAARYPDNPDARRGGGHLDAVFHRIRRARRIRKGGGRGYRPADGGEQQRRHRGDSDCEIHRRAGDRHDARGGQEGFPPERGRRPRRRDR